jgi:hypothetical protein
MKKSSGTWALLHPCICQIAGKYKMKKMKDKSKRKKEKEEKEACGRPRNKHEIRGTHIQEKK